MATPARQRVVDVTIPITSGYSDYVDIKGFTLLAVETPAVWTGATAIAVKGKATSTSLGGVVYDDQGTQITIAADATRTIRLDERLFQGLSFLAFASDGQAAARTIRLVLRDEDSLISDGL